KAAEEGVVNHFSIPNKEHANQFTEMLDEQHISYSVTEIDLMSVNTDLSNVIEIGQPGNEDLKAPMIVVSDRFVEEVDVAESETVFINNNSAIKAFFTFKKGTVIMEGKTKTFELDSLGLNEITLLPLRLTGGGFPIAVLDDSVYQQLAGDVNPAVVTEFPVYVGIDIEKRSELKEANQIFNDLQLGEWAGHESQLDTFTKQKQAMGLIMFIVGFLGLAFLITSGCILYFKQMDEGEEEKGSYTILRKLGFTRTDLLNGIKIKQLFNFGIPLIVGLSHSYFAVKSGWFWFGTEMWTPMIIVMVFYTLLYSIFGILSVMYYKKLIKEAL